MKTSKILNSCNAVVYYCLFFVIVGCFSAKNQPEIIGHADMISPHAYRQVYIIAYGDERFHDCEQLVDVTYGITYSGDTLVLGEHLRPCRNAGK